MDYEGGAPFANAAARDRKKKASGRRGGNSGAKRGGATRVARRPANGAGSGGLGGAITSAVTSEYGRDPTPFGKQPLVRWPDGSSLRTVPMHVETTFTLNADGTTGSNGGARVNSRIKGCVVNAPTYSAGGLYPITGWGTAADCANYATLETNFDRYRFASWGIEVSSVGRQDATAGVVRILTSADDAAAAINDPDDLALHSDEFPVQPGIICRWVSSPLGSDAHAFLAVNSQSSPDAYMWTYPYILASGLDAGTTLRVRVLMNLELLPKEGTLTSMLTDRGPIESVRKALGSQAGALAKRAGSYLLGAALNALQNQAKIAVSGAYAYHGAQLLLA